VRFVARALWFASSLIRGSRDRCFASWASMQLSPGRLIPWRRSLRWRQPRWPPDRACRCSCCT
jgi:hypothetical protein